jgi:bifunctional non-homologous end joining protein LigD
MCLCIPMFFFLGFLVCQGGCTMPNRNAHKNHLEQYQKRRNLDTSPEPKGDVHRKRSSSIFVVQKHAASHLHYDFRLAVDGVLVSWAVPKGIPRKAGIKRLAIQTEDHPLEYATFEGTIPEGEYGAGTVEIWDTGTYANIKEKAANKPMSMQQCITQGIIEVQLNGKLLKGMYALVRVPKLGDRQWLLTKMKS